LRMRSEVKLASRLIVSLGERSELNVVQGSACARSPWARGGPCPLRELLNFVAFGILGRCARIPFRSWHHFDWLRILWLCGDGCPRRQRCRGVYQCCRCCCFCCCLAKRVAQWSWTRRIQAREFRRQCARCHRPERTLLPGQGLLRGTPSHNGPRGLAYRQRNPW